jgi:hypothetical protein
MKRREGYKGYIIEARSHELTGRGDGKLNASDRFSKTRLLHGIVQQSGLGLREQPTDRPTELLHIPSDTWLHNSSKTSPQGLLHELLHNRFPERPKTHQNHFEAPILHNNIR